MAYYYYYYMRPKTSGKVVEAVIGEVETQIGKKFSAATRAEWMKQLAGCTRQQALSAIRDALTQYSPPRPVPRLSPQERRERRWAPQGPDYYAGPKMTRADLELMIAEFEEDYGRELPEFDRREFLRQLVSYSRLQAEDHLSSVFDRLPSDEELGPPPQHVTVIGDWVTEDAEGGRGFEWFVAAPGVHKFGGKIRFNIAAGDMARIEDTNRGPGPLAKVLSFSSRRGTPDPEIATVELIEPYRSRPAGSLLKIDTKYLRPLDYDPTRLRRRFPVKRS